MRCAPSRSTFGQHVRSLASCGMTKDRPLPQRLQPLAPRECLAVLPWGCPSTSGEAQPNLDLQLHPPPDEVPYATKQPAPRSCTHSCSPGLPSPPGPNRKPVQLVQRASREEEPGTLRTRPRAVQLRCGRHCSELELMAEKVPVGHGWHCVFWLGVPGAVTPAPGGHCACSRQKPACAKKPWRQRQARLWVALHCLASSSCSPQMILQ